MIDSRLDINDNTLLDLYTNFQEQRRVLGVIYPNMPYPDFVDHGRTSGVVLPATTIASEHIISVTSTVNRFCGDLHSLIYWSKVLESVSEDDKLMALVEFIVPIANQCLSAPYLTKQTLIKSICKISHHTNRFCKDNWTDSSLKPDKELDFNEAKRLAQHFCTWPKMQDALSRLNDSEFIDASDDYRNKFNHGFPRRIEYGHSMIIDRIETAPSLPTFDSFENVLPPNLIPTFKILIDKHKNAAWYSISNKPPLHITNLVPILAKQYRAAANCHEAYIGLIHEQREVWISVQGG